MQSRQLLQKILDGPMVFQPVVDGEPRGYTFSACIDREAATGVIDLPMNLASPTELSKLDGRLRVGGLRRVAA